MVLRLASLAVLALASAIEAQEPVKAPAKQPPSKAAAPTKQTPATSGKALTTAPATTKPAMPSATPGWLGFRTDPKDRAIVLEVAPDSPAERAGMMPGDRIVSSDQLAYTIATKANAKPGAPASLATYVAGPIAGRTYHMTLARDGETIAISMIAVAPPAGQEVELRPTRAPARVPDTLRAEIDAYRTELTRTTLRPSQRLSTTPTMVPDSLQTTGRAVTLIATRANVVSGAELEQLNPALGEYFGGISEGVLVIRVGAESPAANAGLQPGDVVTTVNGADVATISALRERVADAAGTITLGIVRKGNPATVVLRKEE